MSSKACSKFPAGEPQRGTKGKATASLFPGGCLVTWPPTRTRGCAVCDGCAQVCGCVCVCVWLGMWKGLCMIMDVREIPCSQAEPWPQSPAQAGQPGSRAERSGGDGFLPPRLGWLAGTSCGSLPGVLAHTAPQWPSWEPKGLGAAWQRRSPSDQGRCPSLGRGALRFL